MEALRAAEAKTRADGRDRAGLAKLGPGAVELAAFMDRTGSFLLQKTEAQLVVLGSSGGRLAALGTGLPPPGAASFGTYVMTSFVFNALIDQLTLNVDSRSKTGSKTGDLDPTVDTVTIGGNKGTIKTQVTASVSASNSKISVLMQMKIDGEVRDAATGAILFKIASQTTGVAIGDACPDTSGLARAKFSFRGTEDYLTEAGVRSSGVTEDISSEFTFTADDNAKLAGVNLTPTGEVGGDLMMSMAARSAAPLFEKAWRSGVCVEVLIDPAGDQDVQQDSVTTINVKLRHKSEGNELDKLIEAKFQGVKSFEPLGEKKKSPQTYTYTAGPNFGDNGSVSFESVSNRGIGHAGLTLTVAHGVWTINATGTLVETFNTQVGSGTQTLNIVIKDLKVRPAGFDRDILGNHTGLDAVDGSGTFTITGGMTSGPFPSCVGRVEATHEITARGTVVGKGPGARLKLTLNTTDPIDHAVLMTCTFPGIAAVTSNDEQDMSVGYGSLLGEFVLSADGGTVTITRNESGEFANRRATGTFTVRAE